MRGDSGSIIMLYSTDGERVSLRFLENKTLSPFSHHLFAAKMQSCFLRKYPVQNKWKCITPATVSCRWCINIKNNCIIAAYYPGQSKMMWYQLNFKRLHDWLSYISLWNVLRLWLSQICTISPNHSPQMYSSFKDYNRLLNEIICSKSGPVSALLGPYDHTLARMQFHDVCFESINSQESGVDWLDLRSKKIR